MTDPDATPAEDKGDQTPATSLFSQANITTGLAVLAVVLAAAPYVVPQIQAFQVRKGLLAQPAMLETAIDRLRAQRTEEADKQAAVYIKAHHDSIFNDKDDPVLNPQGTIKVVAFLDYRCAACRASTPILKQFMDENPDVQFVVKEAPIIHPPESRTLAAYAIAAYRAGHYAGLHYALLTEPIRTQEELNGLLAQAGVDPKAAEAIAKSDSVTAQINRTIKLGEDIGVNATPTFFIGDKMISGADIPGMRAAVQAERAKLKTSS